MNKINITCDNEEFEIKITVNKIKKRIYPTKRKPKPNLIFDPCDKLRLDIT